MICRHPAYQLRIGLCSEGNGRLRARRSHGSGSDGHDAACECFRPSMTAWTSSFCVSRHPVCGAEHPLPCAPVPLQAYPRRMVPVLHQPTRLRHDRILHIRLMLIPIAGAYAIGDGEADGSAAIQKRRQIEWQRHRYPLATSYPLAANMPCRLPRLSCSEARSPAKDHAGTRGNSIREQAASPARTASILTGPAPP